MTYCYTPIDSPSFFYADGECGEINHDLHVENGDLDGSKSTSINSIISAALIQLNTDARVGDERGWWGEEFLGFKIGNRAWSIAGEKTPTKDKLTKTEALIREALNPLLTGDMADEIQVKAIQVVNGINANVSILKNGKVIFRKTA